jgi:hypothetical protein
MAEKLFSEGPAQPLLGNERGFFAWQDKVADNYADPGAVERNGNPVVEGPFAGMEEQVKERIKPGNSLRVNVQACQERDGG